MEKVHGMLTAHVLDSKIVDDQGKIDGSCLVCPKGRSAGDGMIAKLG